MNYRRFLRAIYPGVVTFLGVMALGFLANQHGLVLTPTAGVLAGLAVLAELVIVRLPGGTSFTTSFVLVLLALMVPVDDRIAVWGRVMQATQAIVVGSLVGYSLLSIWQRELKLARGLFYVSQHALVSVVAGAIFVLVSARWPAWDVLESVHVPALGAYVLSHALLSQVIVGLRNRIMLAVEEFGLPRTDLLVAFLLSPLSLLAYRIYLLQDYSLGALFLILFPILAMLSAFRLYINIDTTHGEVQLLYSITQNFLSSVTQEETVEVVTRGIGHSLIQLLAFDECLLFNLNEAANEYLLAYSSVGRELLPAVSGKGLLGRVIGSGQGRIVNDTLPTSSLTGADEVWPERTAFLIVPLMAQHLIAGLLVLVRHRKNFNAENFRLISILSAQAAAVLRNAQLYERTLRRAELDPKTQLMHTQTFQEHAQRELARCQQEGRSSALMLADIDDFRVINNTYGHQAGDQVLIALAQIIKHATGDKDLVARYGGEEFVILLSQADSVETRAVAEGIRSAVEVSVFATEDGEKVRFTISIGVALFPADGVDVATLIKKADRAAYLAKSMGKNQVRFYEVQTEMIPPDEGQATLTQVEFPIALEQ
ncbi:MAG: sensor domain-containing diguanylate cyclase [Anaerolineae bacterium]|nr:MAG: sensor domain-containing diguanylate cyclase [Anaerolineae bacterium]